MMDLVEILKRPEGKTLEFKRDLSSPEGALKTVVAFAPAATSTSPTCGRVKVLHPVGNGTIGS